MSYLKVTLIDVGWGDSIFIESVNNSNERRYALVDSNDDGAYQPSIIFLKKYLRIPTRQLAARKPVFDFIMLSHDHSDHATGLRRIIEYFGTQRFWYPKIIDTEPSQLSGLLQYANSSRGKKDIAFHQAVDTEKDLVNQPEWDDVRLDVLWPQPDTIDPNPNNNSIVLTISLGNVSFVLTGDAEGEVWHQIANTIPTGKKVIKVPHHGSVNGTMMNGNTPWLDECSPTDVKLGISCHPTYPRGFPAHPHPHEEVVQEFQNRNYEYYRTDENYHITFSTDGQDVQVKASA